MQTLFRDVRYGFRALRKAPAFTAIAILALGLGIGANTAIFSVADAFLLKPLPLPDTEHLVVLFEQAPGQTGNDISGVAPANAADWQRQTRTLEEITTWMWDTVSITGEGNPDEVEADRVKANFFSICGVKPLLGRTFLPEEDQFGADNEAVLSQGIWERRFGSDPQILGRAIHLDGKPYTVVGVMPKSFRFPFTSDLWLPLALRPELQTRRDWRSLYSMGKLKQGSTPENASAELNSIAQNLADAFPSTNRGWRVRLMTIRRFAIGNDAHDYTLLLLAAVGFVLLLVCANIANLQFVRGASRVKEIAIRTALGGSRWRIIRQLLTESALLGLGGAAVGLLVARWTIRLVLFNMPADVSRTIAGWDEIHVDTRALAFTVVIAVFAGVLAGLFPAMGSTRVSLSDTLKESGRANSSSRGRHRLRSLMVIIQVALAIVLLSGAGLLVRSLEQVRDANQGYRPETLLTMVVNLPAARYSKPDQQSVFFDDALTRLGALPGIQGAATTTIMPFANGVSAHIFNIEGRPWRSAAQAQNAYAESISPNYFSVMGIPLMQGRTVTDQDTALAPQVALISQSLAKAYWENSSPIGHRVTFSAPESPRAVWMTIVGVVADVKMDSSNLANQFAIYRPYRQFPRAYASLVLRTSGDPDSFVTSARAALSAVDAEQSPLNVKTMSQIIKESTIAITYAAAMVSMLGALALGLAAVGVYGVMAYTVTESTHEIGIRMALGALPGNVLRMIVGRGMLLTLAGVAIGVPISFWMAHLMGGYFAGIGSANPLGLAFVSFVLAAVALVACWIPARRATRVDPMVALRHE